MKKKSFLNRLCVIGLTVVCIGGAELAACRWLDPDIYYKITDPVVQAAISAFENGKKLGNDIKDAVVTTAETAAQDIIEAREEAIAARQEIESQQAAEPIIEGGGIEITDAEVSDLVVQNGAELLTGGGIPIYYYAQSDPQWKDKPYGGDNVGAYGCGPAALAMAVRSVTDIPTDPAKMAQWCAEQGFHAPGSGSYHSIVRGVASGFGMQCESPAELTEESLLTRLSGGEIAVALMKQGHFTRTGHFIVLRGVTLTGNVLVADPNSRERSLQEWDSRLILDELSGSRTDGAPLWFLSRMK